MKSRWQGREKQRRLPGACKIHPSNRWQRDRRKTKQYVQGPTCGVFRDGAELARASVQGMGWEVIGDEAPRRDTIRKCHKYHAGELGFDPRRRGRALGQFKQEIGVIRPVDFREDSDSRHGLEG